MAVVLVSKPLTVLTLYNNRKQIQKGIVQGGNSMSFLVGERSMVAHGVWWNGLCPCGRSDVTCGGMTESDIRKSSWSYSL